MARGRRGRGRVGDNLCRNRLRDRLPAVVLARKVLKIYGPGSLLFVLMFGVGAQLVLRRLDDPTAVGHDVGERNTPWGVLVLDNLIRRPSGAQVVASESPGHQLVSRTPVPSDGTRQAHRHAKVVQFPQIARVVRVGRGRQREADGHQHR